MRAAFKKVIVIPLLPLILLISVFQAKAQKLAFVFGHALYASPVDKNFNGAYKFGLGVEGGAAIGLNKTFLVGTVGYNYFPEEAGNSAGSVNVIPYTAGLRHYILGKLLYIHGDVGIATIKYKNAENSTSRFTADAGAGIKLAAFEAQIDYQGFSRKDPLGFASWIAVKAGFRIGL